MVSWLYGLVGCMVCLVGCMVCLVGWLACLVGNATEVKVPLELTSGLGSFIGFRHRGSRILLTFFPWHPWVRFDHGPCDRRAFNMVRATGHG